MAPAPIPIARVRWPSAKRIIATRFPSVDILSQLVDPEDIDALRAIDDRTNPRLAVPGSSVIMAPFVHVNPNGSRFSDGRFGIFYAAHRLPTALAEVRYHRERFLIASHEPPQTLELMLYEAAIAGDFHDIRASANRGWYGAVSYARSQPLGARLHRAGSSGIVYQSVRDRAGECVAVFRPPLVKRCRPVKPLFAHWDGTRITRITTLVPTA